MTLLLLVSPGAVAGGAKCARAVNSSVSNEGYPKVRNHGEGFSWLKAATTAFIFKTLLRHYAKQALSPRSLIVILSHMIIASRT